MEGNMLESNVEPEIILGRVQRQMKSYMYHLRLHIHPKKLKNEGLEEDFFKDNP
jgi:hypothetical protein